MANNQKLREGTDKNISSASTLNRRYVGSKETIAYILDDISQSFNINSTTEIFTVDVLQIGLKFLYVVKFIKSIWDAVNDIFIAALIDRTRTRWGKFKPWLVIYAIPGVLISLLFWLQPVIFSNRGLYDVPKLVFFFFSQMLSELAGTVITVARTGMTATITPNITERTRLITQANLFSGFVEKAPELLMNLLIDLIEKNKIKLQLKTLFVSAGTITTVVAGAMALIYAFVAKERITQTVDRPKLRESFKSIFNNKPLLLLTISEFLGAFSTGGDAKPFYFKNVLGYTSMQTVVGIPGAVVSPVSYSYVPWARSKFSTKALWVAGSHVDNFLMSGVFIVGLFNKNYKKLSAMIPAWMLRETIFMFFFGIRKVIPEEMRNEAIDYGEWKNGYRSEGMTGVAKDLVSKLVRSVSGTVSTFILSRVGYVQGAGFGEQNEKTEFALFALCTALPAVTGILSIVPKFFYDLSGEKKDRMYAELEARRRATAEELYALKETGTN